MTTPGKCGAWHRRTGNQKLIVEITTADRAGMNSGFNCIQTTGDGKTYAYSFLQKLSELYFLEGLK
jgi:hypothetical protein